MNDLVRQELCQIIRSHGLSVCDDPKRLRGMLADLCPDFKREVQVLTSALEQRVASDLLTGSGNHPWEVVSARLVHRLGDELAMTEDAARWAVESWGVALGKLPARSAVKDPVIDSEPDTRSGRRPMYQTAPQPPRNPTQPTLARRRLPRRPKPATAAGAPASGRMLVAWLLMCVLVLGSVGVTGWWLLRDRVRPIQPDEQTAKTGNSSSFSAPPSSSGGPSSSAGSREVETVLGANRKDDDKWNYMIDDKNKIGYIRLTQFSGTSARDMARVMADLTRKGIKGFILDLRFNPGGLLDSAVKITDMYIDDGLIVSVRPRVGREQKSYGFHKGSLLDFPMVCLVNGDSGGGSEIVSAALQDHKRALIIGERSSGKGSVQNNQEFENGEIKMTTASFWRPSGKSLNKSSTSGKSEEDWGVRPDMEVALTRTERENLAEHQHKLEIIQRPDRKPPEPVSDFKDKQIDKALEYLRDQIKTATRLRTPRRQPELGIR